MSTEAEGRAVNDTGSTPTPADAVDKAASGDTAAVSGPPPVPPAVHTEQWLTTGQWGMLAFLLSDVALFGTLIVTYIAYIGNDSLGGPRPREVLSMGLVIVTTIILLSSSATVHMAEKALHAGAEPLFRVWWGLTILLGVGFLVGTGYEWYELIDHHGLTIGRNMFGTTFYTLVGFHGMHVTSGVIIMLVVLYLSLAGRVGRAGSGGVQMISWYWHFVDVVWIAVFSVVYLFGRWG